MKVTFGGRPPEIINYVQAVEIEQKASLMYFKDEKVPFFKVTFALPTEVTTARGTF